MEFGLIAKLEQHQFNSMKKTQVVNETKPIQALKKEIETENIDKKELKESRTSKVSKAFNESLKIYHEVSLSNTVFGFNESSKDFYVKVSRGEFENKYPTDQMMKLKAYFIALSEIESEISSES